MNCFSQTYILKSHAFHIRDCSWFSNICKKEVRMYFKTKTNCDLSLNKFRIFQYFFQVWNSMNSLSLSPHSSSTVRLYSYYDLPNFFIFFILMYPSQFGTCYRMFKRDVNISQWVQKTLWIRISILVWTLSKNIIINRHIKQ